MYLWIREGRLPAIKTPGAQYRVRTDDARAYCEKNGPPMPREVASPAGAIAILGKPSVVVARLRRHARHAEPTWLRGRTRSKAFSRWRASAPDVVAIDAGCTDIKPADALRALQNTAATASVPVVIYDALAYGKSRAACQARRPFDHRTR